MMTKVRKGLEYIKVRWYEWKVCVKEFRKGSKLKRDTYQIFYENSLLVEVHSVEKGLGLRNTQPGHSSKQVNNLISKLFGYMGRGYDIHRFAFRETLRVLTAYIAYQKQFDTAQFPAFCEIERKYLALCDKLGWEFVEEVNRQLQAGARTLSREELEAGKTFDFAGFIATRHSVRMFEQTALDEQIVAQAVEMANQAPSACNRQPSNVYFSNQRSIVDQIDQLITGSHGFKGETPNYLVLTADRAKFMREEQFQWYINGGIYLAYLTLALHSLGVGCCIMQWKAFYRTEKQLKQVLGISDQEAIVAIIGCGYFADETKCICAQRKRANEVLKVVG